MMPREIHREPPDGQADRETISGIIIIILNLSNFIKMFIKKIR